MNNKLKQLKIARNTPGQRTRGLQGRITRITLITIVVLLPILALFTLYDVGTQQRHLEDLVLANAKSIAIAGAKTIGQIFELAIATGQLTKDQVFDNHYIPFWYFDPTKYPDFKGDPASLTKYHTSFDAFTDVYWPSVIDAYLTNSDLIYASALDVNGYVPTHNKSFSSGDGSPATDRTKRIFADPVGVNVARNTEPVLQQIYQQPGTGKTVWDISAPIMVNDEHWGAFRVGVELTQNQARVTEALWGTVAAMFSVFLVVILFAVGIGRYMALPITRLTEAATQAASGRLDQQVAIPNRGEITILAQAFNTMTTQLRGLIGSLETQVQARTEQLRASADVGRAAATILEPDQLLREAVNLITDRFGLYYAAVFTLDSAGKFAVLREATGEAGRTLKERHHQLEVGGQSMVGYVTKQRKARIALDVGAEAVRFANPLLPETRSEIALPLVVGERVLGALDVQSKHEAAFDEASAAVLQAMADQIAIALNNATLFVESQTVARRSRALYDASREVGHLEADPATTIGAMMRTASDTVDLQVWWVLIFDERQTMLTTLAVSAAHQDWPKAVPILGFENNPIVRSAVYSEPHVMNDPLNDPYLKDAPLEQSFLFKTISVPIISRGASVGALVLGRALDQPDLAQGDLEVAQSLASLAAIAIENSRLLSQTQRALSELDAINRRLTGESWAAFARRRSTGGLMWISTMEQSSSLGGTDRAQHEPLPEVTEALYRGEIAIQPIGRGEQLGVAVPIKLRDVTIGALRLVIPQRAWNADTITTLDSIAGHVAQAAENARLLEQTQRTAQREKAIAGAADKIHRSTDLDTVLRAAVAEINRITGLGGVSIQLGFGEAEPADGNGRTTGTDGGK